MTMHCIDRPGASPAFVFVHGFACAREDWRAQIAHFAGRRRVIACDLRGHGRTPGLPEQCSIETFGADVAALLEAKGLTGAVLAGHSMGCRVVLQAYLNAAQRVRAIALIDGSYQGTGGSREGAEQAARATIANGGYENFARRLFTEMFLAPSPQADAIVRRALEFPAAAGELLFPRLAGWDAANMERALAAVKVPLLVIQSTYLNAERKRVALAPGETTPWLELVRRAAPAARIEILSGAGHFPQLELPERLNALLAALAAR
jgi:pimeloyl-ACP methyl ester carboxylesterase